jgi:Swiss Army Knife RNA repair-like protein
MVDIDGVISLFGVPLQLTGERQGREGSFHSIDGTPHFLSSIAAAHLLELARLFDLVWASGWEERADEHLPHLLGLPAGLPFLRFERGARSEGGPSITHGHWKLDSIEAYAGERPLAWVDDALSPACHEWADARAAPTLLVETQPERGLTEPEAQLLEAWALQLAAG